MFNYYEDSLNEVYSTVSDSGYLFEYSDNKLEKIIKYQANGDKM